MKYFDVKPPLAGTKPQREDAVEPWMPAPRSYDENLDRIESEINIGQTSATSFPTSLSVSVTNYCSLRCPMCCFGIIPPELKKPTTKLIDPIVLDRLSVVYPYLRRLDLVGGELFDIPFENNPLVRILADIADANPTDLGVTITTNGQHLTEKWAEYLVQFPFIDIVAFSVDSFDPDVYARTRIMGSLDRVRRSIGNIQNAKAAHALSHPIIRLNTIVGAHTHDGVPTFVDNARRLGVERHRVSKACVDGRSKLFRAEQSVPASSRR